MRRLVEPSPRDKKFIRGHSSDSEWEEMAQNVRIAFSSLIQMHKLICDRPNYGYKSLTILKYIRLQRILLVSESYCQLGDLVALYCGINIQFYEDNNDILIKNLTNIHASERKTPVFLPSDSCNIDNEFQFLNRGIA